MTAEEICGYRKGLCKKKSAGEDGLPNNIIKKLPGFFDEISARIFNSCLEIGYFPTTWKVAEIYPIPKATKLLGPKDCRPISLLSNWGKILERVIMDRLSDDDGEIIGMPAHQFAYRKGHGTIHAADMVLAEIKESTRLRKQMGLCALDISKAFDSVWKEGLIYKLDRLGVETHTLRMIFSFMSDRKARVGDRLLEDFDIQRGVRQGSILGPVLYKLYTADFHWKRDENQGMVQYADDTLLWVKGRSAKRITEQLRDELHKATKEMTEWGITVNKEKTKFLPIVCSRRKKQQEFRKTSLVLDRGNVKVDAEPNIKYLGIWIDGSGSLRSHIDGCKRKALMAYGRIRWLLKKKDLSVKVKTLLYKQLIRPMLCYGVGLYRSKKDVMNKVLPRTERQVLRCITGLYRRPETLKWYSNKELYAGAGLTEDISEVLRKQNEKFLEKRETHRNQWYLQRVLTLEEKTTSMRIRNLEYEEHKQAILEEKRREREASRTLPSS